MVSTILLVVLSIYLVTRVFMDYNDWEFGSDISRFKLINIILDNLLVFIVPLNIFRFIYFFIHEVYLSMVSNNMHFFKKKFLKMSNDEKITSYKNIYVQLGNKKRDIAISFIINHFTENNIEIPNVVINKYSIVNGYLNSKNKKLFYDNIINDKIEIEPTDKEYIIDKMDNPFF